MTFINKRTLALIAAGLAVVLMSLALAQAGGSSRRSGGAATAHRGGRVVAAANAPVARTFSVGEHAMEPTLGLDENGKIFFAAAGFGNVGLASTKIMRSTDHGQTWKDSSPRVLDRNAAPVSLDPYVYVDNIGGKKARIFTIDLTVACSYMSFSDDGGDSWITNPLACGRPVNDHQTLFSGPPAITPMPIYPNVLYYCWNDVGSSACSKSTDGGVSFRPTGAPAFMGADPNSQDPGFGGAGGVCGGLHGHGAVGPEGNVYLPREYCGVPMLAVSSDEGLTWDQIKVSDIRSTSQPKGGAGHPSVAVDEKGNVYYLFINEQNRQPYLSVSKDQGQTWSKPVMAGRPGLKETNLPQIDARGVGKVAFVYYGSANSPFQRCRQKCEATDYTHTKWNGYVTMSANALSPNPTFFTGQVNASADPLVRGRCGPGRCQQVFDFIDVEIGPDGIPYGAFVDGCMGMCVKAASQGGEYEGLMTKLTGGPRLD